MSDEITFAELPLSQNIQEALTDMGFKSPTEIQAKSIPLLVESDCDFVGQAQTGTGKTAAFGLPLIMKLDASVRAPQSLILAPTRELALQISDELQKFSKYQRINKVNLCGGMSYKPQLDALKSGRAQVVVGTPGRVIDLLNRGALDLSEIKQIILDEADEMLNMGFWEDVVQILESSNENKNLWMFSATIPPPIKKLIGKSFKNPVFVNTKSKSMSNEDIEQSYYLIKDRYKLTALYQILNTVDKFYGVIFCQTKQETKDLAFALMDKNYNVSVLHGDLAQGERNESMRNFKKGKTKVLICTDVASRGIDVENLTHVINFGLPRERESYIHRIGRTGRAGNKGFAISVLDRTDLPRLRKIEGLLKIKIPQAKLPKPEERKRIHIANKAKKYESLRYNLEQEKEQYFVDDVFGDFEEKFEGLDKGDTLKLIFNSLFRNELRHMDEQSDIELDVAQENVRSSRSSRGSYGGGGGRDGGRSRNRNRSASGGGRSRDDRRSSDRSESSDRPRRPRSNSRDAGGISERSSGEKRESRGGYPSSNRGGEGSSRPKRLASGAGGGGGGKSSFMENRNKRKKPKSSSNTERA